MEDKLLMLVAKNYGYKNWNAVASHFQGRTSIQCCARFKRVRPGRIKGIWTVKEDNKLLKLVERYGKNWGLISNYMCSRTGKQIRDRYLNSLDPKLNKTRFTDEEDKIILKYYLKYGSKWTKIAYYLNGRSGDMVKNRFYSFIRMKCKINRKTEVFSSYNSLDYNINEEKYHSKINCIKKFSDNMSNIIICRESNLVEI